METSPSAAINGKETARDTFLHLLSAAMLYLSVIGFIALWWQIINFLFPDKLNPQGSGSRIYMTLIWGASVLAVAYPVHILVSWIIGKDLRETPTKREGGVRKWLWYITLFVSALTIVIDLVTLIYNYLRGDLTAQFFLKLAVILAVTAAVFGYFLWDLRKKEMQNDIPRKIAIIVAVAILVSMAYGFYLSGSPAKQRNMRFDEQRISELQQIQNYAVNYYQQKGNLPVSLDELGVVASVPKDPETGKDYEYSQKGDLAFEICADFKTERASIPAAREMDAYYYKPAGLKIVPEGWGHGVGRACFETTIDKDFFKKINIPAGKNILMAP